MSPVIRLISGHDASEFLGRQLPDFISRDDVMAFVKGMERNRSGDSRPFEFQLAGKDGTQRWVQTSGKPVVSQDVITGYQGLMTDIQERKRTADALCRTAKQISLLNRITRHDILNGITKLLGYLGVLRDQVRNKEASEILDKQQEFVTTTQQQINFTRDY